MPTRHQATDSRGQVHNRTSAERVYTHAVVTHYPAWTWANGSTTPPHSKAEWSGSLALAQKNAASKKHPHEIVEARIVSKPSLRQVCTCADQDFCIVHPTDTDSLDPNGPWGAP